MTLRSQRKNRDVNWELDVSEAKNSKKKKDGEREFVGNAQCFWEFGL